MNPTVYVAINLAFALLILYEGLANSRKFLFLCAFVLPLEGIAIDVGILVNWSKLVLPLAVLACIARSRNPFSLKTREPAMLLWAAFLGYAVLITSAHMILHTYEEDTSTAIALGWGPGQTTYRLPVQLASTLLCWGVLFAATSFVRDKADFKAVIKGLIAGNVFNAIIGFYGIASGALGLPWFGTIIGRDAPAVGRVVTESRLSGLAGEPKHAAAGFVFALLLLLWTRRTHEFARCAQFFTAKAALLTVALLLTFSTSGWVAATVGLTYVQVVGRKALHGRAFRLLVLVLLACMVIAAVTSVTMFDEIVRSRILARAADPGRYEYKEKAFWQYAVQHPETLVFGNGAGGIDFKLIPYTDAAYLAGSTPSPTYLVDDVLSDFGVIGLLILSLAVGMTVKRLRRSRCPHLAYLIKAGALVALCVPRFSVWGFVFVVGAALSYATSTRNVLVRSSNSIGRLIDPQFVAQSYPLGFRAPALTRTSVHSGIGRVDA